MVPTETGLQPNKELFLSAIDDYVDTDIQWTVLDPLLDSSQITPKNWQQILASIDYKAHATIILHGTDTLAYTAAMLSFFAKPDHPLVVTGSQLSWFEDGSDAPANLDLALLACTTPGCHIAFGDKLLPARTCYKLHTEAFDGFAQYDRVEHSHTLVEAIQPVRYHWLTPIPGQLIPKLDELDVLILDNLGSGQVPESSELKTLLTKAKHVLVTSQCPHGNVDLSRYAANEFLRPYHPISCGRARREEIIAACYAAFSQQESPPGQWLTNYFAIRSA